MALRGLNAQYINEEGSNMALLEERKEPLNNAECRGMLSTPNGTVLRGSGRAVHSTAVGHTKGRLGFP